MQKSLLTAFVVWSAACAHADLQYTEQMKMGATQGQFTISTTKWLKKDAERTETMMNIGPMKTKTVEIVRCDQKQRFQVAPDLKIYTVADFDKPGGMFPVPPMMGGMPGMHGIPHQNEAPATGTMSVEYSLQDLGAEKVAETDTHHYSLNVKTTATGCAGSGTQNLQMETWVADIPLPTGCGETGFEGFVKGAMRLKPTCDVKTEVKGDTAAMGKAFSGLVMRLKINGMQGGTMTKEVTSVSRAELDDAPFSIPADFKEVSAQEFGQAQGRAMMKAMMGGEAAE